MMRARDPRPAALAASALALLAGLRLARTAETLIDNGPPENRIDLVVTGDGYTAEEQEQLRSDATRAARLLLDAPPFRDQSALFNVHLVFAVSAESGADHPSRDVYRDTRYGAAYDFYGIERLIGINEWLVYSAVAAEVPFVDYILVVVNDPEYGGSGGDIIVVSVHEAVGELVRHEFGHTFADLADEYEDAFVTPTDDHEPNVSFAWQRDLLKWAIWVEPETPLPTPDTAAAGYVLPIGAYEGAKNMEEGIYRPAPECRMRALDRPYCAVCGEALLLASWRPVDPIEAPTPTPGPIEVDLPSSFTAALVLPPERFEIAWFLDGTAVGTGAVDLLLRPDQAAPGDHELVLSVRDPTAWVRNDPEDLLRSERRWSLRVLAADADADADDDAAVDDDAGTDDGAGEDGGTAGADDGCGCRASGSAPSGGSVLALAAACLVSRRRPGLRPVRGSGSRPGR